MPNVDIDAPIPKALDWFKARGERLRDSPDSSPPTITDAARQIEAEMDEAFRRRQCDDRWTWGYIKTQLLTLGYWPRTRPPR